MAKINLNLLDKKILQELLVNARINHRQLAKKVGSTSEKVTYRINRMQKAKIIVKFVTQLNIKELGYNEYTLLIKLEKIDTRIIKNAEKKLSQNKSITFAATILGTFDLRINFIARNPLEIQEVVDEIFAELENNVLRHELLQRVKKSFTEGHRTLRYILPNEKGNTQRMPNIIKKNKTVSFTTLDWSIINYLQKHPLASHKEIGDNFNLTGETISHHMKKLNLSGLVSFSVYVNFESLGFSEATAMVRIKNRSQRKNIVSKISTHAQTKSIAEYASKWDFDFTLYATSFKGLYEYLFTIREDFETHVQDTLLFIHNKRIPTQSIPQRVLDEGMEGNLTLRE